MSHIDIQITDSILHVSDMQDSTVTLVQLLCPADFVFAQVNLHRHLSG